MKYCSILFVMFLTGCSAVQTDSKLQKDHSSLVKLNADKAVAACGKGNVHEVTKDGFTCKSR